MSNFIVDTNKKQITFLDNRFYQTDSEDYVPSVTTILNAYPKDAGYYQWLKSVGEDADTIRDEAGRRGSIVHELTERYDAGEEINLLDNGGRVGFKLSEWSMFERYVDFRNRFKLENELIEFNVISPELGFAGTIDRVITMNGKRYLVDIKTSNAIYDSYWLQLAAYEQLLNYAKIDIDEVAILWLNAKTRTNGKDGSVQGIGWQFVTRSENETNNDWRLFLATKTLWLAQNGNMQPRKQIYNITHKI